MKSWDDCLKDFVIFKRYKYTSPSLLIATPIESTIAAKDEGIESDSDKSGTPKCENKLFFQKPFDRSISEVNTGVESSVSDGPFLEKTESKLPKIPFEVEKMAILSSMLDCEDFEPGIVNNSEHFFKKFFEEDSLSALNGISALFMNNFSCDSKKVHRLVGTLHIVSHMEYTEVYPSGQMMAISALSHENRQVSEYGIKCFENWGHPDGVEKLKAIKFSTPWLQEYANDVIDEINAGD